MLRIATVTLIILQFSAYIAMSDCARSAAPKPDFLAGRWVLRNASDYEGRNWNGSTLRFTSRKKTPTGYRLTGYFDWRLGGETAGRESVKGSYDARTRRLSLEGYSIERGGVIVSAAYRAVLSKDGMAILQGTWQSTTGGQAAVPGKWEATLARRTKRSGAKILGRLM
jgi:hypothetical protein